MKISMDDRFWEKVKRVESGCMEWQASCFRNGYGCFYHSGLGRMTQASRVAWELVNSEIPKGMYVLHHCDNPKCVNPDHLYIGDQTDNMRDMAERGRRNDAAGEKNSRAILTEKVVLRMRQLHKSGETIASVARKYNICHGTASAAIHGRNWSHI